MGFSLFNPQRPKDGRKSKLPIYRQLTPERPATKERYSRDDDGSDSDASEDYSVTSSPSSRKTSGSQAALMTPPKRAFGGLRRPGGAYFYRLPNKVIRYLCLAMVTTILLFILSLVRASQVENWKIENGEAKKPAPQPAAWETFRFLRRYYGGVRTLLPLARNQPEYPKQEDEVSLDRLTFNTTVTDTTKRELPLSMPFPSHPLSGLPKFGGEVHECFLDENNTIRIPPIRYYEGRTSGFPDNVLGSYELLSLPEDICFDRYGRYGPYGFGYSVRSGGTGTGEHGEREGFESVWSEVDRVDYRKVNWADVQRRCYKSNSHRFKQFPERLAAARGFYHDQETQDVNATLEVFFNRDGMPTTKGLVQSTTSTATDYASSTTSPPTPTPTPFEEVGKTGRTAVVVRCWDEFFFREEDVMNLRSLLSELMLASGGKYDVHLLVQVKNEARNPIWADEATYLQTVQEAVPEEFWGLVTLWTETQMLATYQGIFDLFTRGPGLPVHGVYRGLQMAMQVFAYNHPEYDYFWQWEMDIRYTGHYLDLLTKVENWALEQPRKGLWERNARFYMPTVHGSWDDFKQMARVQTEMGVPGAEKLWGGAKGAGLKDPQSITKGENSVWGPLRPRDELDWYEPEKDPKPPATYERDKYVWGVGEEADLITLNPIFDPEGTTWLLADDITGYNKTDGLPPRRAQIVTASRLSRRLLMTMHRETAFLKHFAFSEMWPATAALQHGFKAVFAPHPLFVDREWPTEYFARVLNAGKNGASGGARTSVFGQREHNLRGLTWFYNSGFAPNLYRRWMGLKVNNDGGEQFELTEDQSKDDSSVGTMRGGEGRMCVPPMLIHPVKDVQLPVEDQPEGHEVPESDPSA